MSIRIVQLGSPRAPEEGLRIGAVRYPPRGVPRSEYARRDIYDVWLPVLAPSAELLRLRRAAAHEEPHDDDAAWRQFARRYRKEMGHGDAVHVLDVLAAMSHGAAFSLGCYCLDLTRCHRSVLRELLEARGASLAG